MRRVDKNALYEDDLNIWIRRLVANQNTFQLGLTDWAQGYMGPIKGIEFHVLVGQVAEEDALLVTFISDKVTTEIHLPQAATILELNTAVLEEPMAVNQDCYQKGWLLEMAIDENDQLQKWKDASWYESSIDSFFRKGD